MTSPPVARHIDADKSGGLDSEEFRAGMTRCAHRGPSPVPETTTKCIMRYSCGARVNFGIGWISHAISHCQCHQRVLYDISLTV